MFRLSSSNLKIWFGIVIGNILVIKIIMVCNIRKHYAPLKITSENSIVADLSKIVDFHE